MGKVYERSSERFSEITFETSKVISMLKEAGFSDIRTFEDMTFAEPNDKTERITFCCVKE